MDNDGSTLERLRRKLASLESAQRAAGGTACAEFWLTPSPDAAPPGSTGAAHPSAGPELVPGEPAPEPEPEPEPEPVAHGEHPAPLTIHYVNWARVKGAYAAGFTFAADSLHRPDLHPPRMSETDLLESVTVLAQIQHHREVNLVQIVTELEARGIASPGGLSRVDWLRSLDPTLTGTAAKAVVTCAAAFHQPRWHTLRDAVIGERLASVGEAGNCEASATDAAAAEAAAAAEPTIAGGAARRVTVGKAAQVIDFHARLKPVADPDDLEQAVTQLTEQSATLRPEDLARLVRELSDQVRPPKDTEDLDQKRRNGRGLWFLAPNAAGMVGLTGTLDPEGAAIIKAAIDPLSCPCPLTDEDGVKIEDDPRPAHQRRMDALIEIVARGVSSPGHPPRTEKAKIVVTIDLENLREETLREHSCREQPTRPASHPFTRTSSTSTNPGGGARFAGSNGAAAGRRGGSCMSGDIVTAATVRRWACDAAIIPVVLGSDSQPLDIGRQERLVTRPMRTLLWLRDQGCSFPGCSMPAQWTDAHHVRHWINGGETSVSNLALLCRRHHVYVHDKRLTATITDTGVTWHTWQHWRTAFGSDPPDQPKGSATPTRNSPEWAPESLSSSEPVVTP